MKALCDPFMAVAKFYLTFPSSFCYMNTFVNMTKYFICVSCEIEYNDYSV